ncbi:hypothetical protein BBP40_001140 [Aspergillus hancockii]|nr:hypothetical protein BBP40_001140 [Aspergillus hancockii]
MIWFVASYTFMVTVILGVCFSTSSLPNSSLLSLFSQRVFPVPLYAYSKNFGSFKKPDSLKVVALVPFRDHERTEILDCYLQRNLVDKQGLIDQVVFIPQTNDTESLKWLMSAVERTASYRIAEPSDLEWEGMNKNVVFIRIDGDIVFLEDHTIPTIIKTKLDHPGSLMVSANVINQGVLEALHSHPGVALPYLPELSPNNQSLIHTSQDWRATNLPTWEGPANFEIHKGFSPPSETHRWLPSPDEYGDRTPIGMSMYGDNGPELKDWTVHAQQHYSFLQHLECGDLYRYKFPIWLNPTGSINPNFLSFRGGDSIEIMSISQQKTDDLALNVAQDAKGENRDVIIDGKGLAAHYSTEAGSEGLGSTDLLSRYRAYAKEMVCLETL